VVIVETIAASGGGGFRGRTTTNSGFGHDPRLPARQRSLGTLVDQATRKTLNRERLLLVDKSIRPHVGAVLTDLEARKLRLEAKAGKP